MQGLAHCAVTGVQLLDHALDLFAQTNGVQIHTEHIGTAVQSLQAAEVLLAFLDLKGLTMACSSASSGSGEISKGWPLSSMPFR